MTKNQRRRPSQRPVAATEASPSRALVAQVTEGIPRAQEASPPKWGRWRRPNPDWPRLRVMAARGLWVAAAGVWIVLGIMAVMPPGQPMGRTTASASPRIVVGIPGGAVIETLAPSATASLEPTPSSVTAPTATPTPAPTPVPALAESVPTTVPTTAPTIAPVAAATPIPVLASATAQPTPRPVVASVGSPVDAVAAFYGHVAAGEFDAAYALWSDRMKATYPRTGNLDDRFAETASIVFDQLFVAEASGQSATVQANFTEIYDSGGSRDFIGYWRLVLVENRWLLDEPHY